MCRRQRATTRIYIAYARIFSCVTTCTQRVKEAQQKGSTTLFGLALNKEMFPRVSALFLCVRGAFCGSNGASAAVFQRVRTRMKVLVLDAWVFLRHPDRLKR